MSIDPELMEQIGLYAYERILCGNMANGHRFETYVIPGKRGSRAIVLNGATAHLGQAGDLLTIMSYTWVEETQAQNWQPRVIVLNQQNQIVNTRGT